ncbi:MAG: nuclear transport factor 2 family protein [Gammaproteobacteria bacterium]
MSGTSAVVRRFQQLFRELGSDNLERLAGVYADEIVFEDPLHRVEGLASLTDYFARMYDGVEAIDFDFHDVLENEGQAMLTWTMRMTHKRLRPGEELALPGASHIRYRSDRVTWHRDYFDVGAMIYERLPVLGALVRAVRARV